MPEEAFDRFTALDDDVAAGVAEWSTDARACMTLGAAGDLPGFRDCLGNVWTEADSTLAKAAANVSTESGEVSAECLDAATKYATAISNLRTAAALARGYADSLDVRSMPGALKGLAKGRKAHAKASARVRAACEPS
jgi:hypothetical protein